MQRALQRLAKPWYRRRALRVFRDSTGLSVNPHLWGSIETAMDESEWFVLLTSPEAAASEWVNREIEHWKQTRDPSRILPVLTDGEWHWDRIADDFDRARSTAVPERLQGVYDDEPRHLDLRWARTETQLDLRNSRFRDAMAELAAPIRGTTKDELENDDIRLHRRAMRSAGAGVVVLGVLLIAAIVGAALAVANSNRAEDREREAEARALSAASRSLLADELDTALLLAAEAYDLDQSVETRGSLVAALERAPQLVRILQPQGPVEGLNSVAFSPDGSQLVAGGEYIARNPDDPALEAPIFRWDLAGTELETWAVPGGTAHDIRAVGDSIAFATVGDDGGTGLIGGDQDEIVESTFSPDLSPDGTRAVVYARRAVELVDLESGARLFRAPGIWQIGLQDFSHDSRWAALPAAVGEAAVVDAGTGDRIGNIGVPGDPFVTVEFSANGNRLAVAHESGSLTMFGIERAGLEPVPLAMTGATPAVDVALSADGTRFAALEEGGRLAVWDTVNGDLLWEQLRPPIEEILSPDQPAVALSSDGRFLIEIGPGGAVLRDATTGVVLAGPEPDGALLLNPEGTRAAVTGRTLSVWDLERGTLVGAHPAGDGGATFSPDNRFLVTHGEDLLLWDLTRRELTPVALDDGADSVLEVAFNDDSSQLASVGDGQAARVWSLDGGAGLLTELAMPRQQSGTLAAIDPATGTTAVRVGTNGALVVRSPDQEAVRVAAGPELWFVGLAGDRFVMREPTENDRTHAVLRDIATGRVIAEPLPCGSGQSAFLASVTVMTADRIVNVNPRRISVCDPADGSLLAEHSTPEAAELPFEAFLSVAMAPDSALVAIGSPNGTVTVVDAETGELVATIPFVEVEGQGVASVAFSPDGSQLAFAASFPGRVGVWTVGDDPNDVRILDPSGELLTAVAISPDGNRVAVAGQSGATDAATEIQIMALDGQAAVGEALPWPYPLADIQDLEFTADGTELYGTSIHGGLARWAVSEEGWRDRACQLAGRNLTRAEWDRLVPGRAYRITCKQWPAGE